MKEKYLNYSSVRISQYDHYIPKSISAQIFTGNIQFLTLCRLIFKAFKAGGNETNSLIFVGTYHAWRCEASHNRD